jgi:hypothetical protein
MKVNLPANLQRLAFTALVLVASVAGFLLCGGCSSPTPNAAEKFLFQVETNRVAVPTNWMTIQTVTNQEGATEQVPVMNWRTNIQEHVTYTVSTNAAALTQSASRLTNIFAPGFGELIAALAAGVLGTWAKLRSTLNKGKAANVTLAQSIETLLAIVETTPQGRELSDRLKTKLVKDQSAAGVLAEIAHVVNTYVDNDAAKKAAQLILDSLPKPQA